MYWCCWYWQFALGALASLHRGSKLLQVIRTNLRGARPKKLFTAIANAVGNWWKSSGPLLDAVLGVIVFGYAMPSVVLVVVTQSEGVSLVQTVDYALARQVGAVTFGAATEFKWIEIPATELTGFKSMASFLCGLVGAIAGSVSLAQVLLRWLANLVERVAFKFNQWALRRLETSHSEKIGQSR
jgi:hypothetical protein